MSHAKNTEIILSLRNVGVSYRSSGGIFGKQFWALEDVSIDLFESETLGVIGRNGAGKSTLLRVMAGVLKPDRGMRDCRVKSCTLLSLGLGFIPYLSGRENVILSGLL